MISAVCITKIWLMLMEVALDIIKCKYICFFLIKCDVFIKKTSNVAKASDVLNAGPDGASIEVIQSCAAKSDLPNLWTFNPI